MKPFTELKEDFQRSKRECQKKGLRWWKTRCYGCKEYFVPSHGLTFYCDDCREKAAKVTNESDCDN